MKPLFTPLILSALLAGCVVAPYNGSSSSRASAPIVQRTPVHVGGAPLYTASGAPVYSGPPVIYRSGSAYPDWSVYSGDGGR
jgi:hypothetical protein